MDAPPADYRPLHGGYMTPCDVVLEATGLDGPITLATTDTAVGTRIALGLPTDRPVVATGHQPALHHGGLVAKDMAASLLAERCGGVAAHLMLDTAQDPVFGVEVPASVDGRWTARPAIIAQESSHPLWRRSPAHITAGGAIDIHVSDAANAITQAESLLRWQWKRISLEPFMLRASSLLNTLGGTYLLDAMRSNPHDCARTLSHALEVERIIDMRRPETGDDPQLPLWVSEREHGTTRRMARASDLDHDGLVLEPRAVLTSALMRMFVCDRFIHGTGGGRYDRATTCWLRDWLDVDPPPPAVVTAHVRIDADAWLHADHAVAEARAALRRARHDLDTGAPSPAKAAMLGSIQAAPEGSAQRHAAFQAMHAQLRLDAPHRQRAAEVALEAAIEQAQILRRRDWPLVGLPEERTAALWETVSDTVSQ